MSLFYEDSREHTAPDRAFPFDAEAVAKQVTDAVLYMEGCPWEADVSVTIVTDGEIRELNAENRGIDRATDVLSFPMVAFAKPGDFREAEESPADSFDPESGNLLLGDIVISADRVFSQAEEYGHSVLREFAFLVAHSALHLLGYDHMAEAEEAEMTARQEKVLSGLGITRE